MSDLLPHNVTPFESALGGAVARISDVPPIVRDVWNPDTCPADLLPWLAWAFSVDQWDPAWSSSQKRETIRRAVEVQRVKGTPAAVRRGLGAIDIDAQLIEWHAQPSPGAPYTYQLVIDASANAATIQAIAEAVAIVDELKSLRSHLETIQVATSSRAGPIMAAVASIGSDVTVGPAGVLFLDEWSDAGVWNDHETLPGVLDGGAWYDAGAWIDSLKIDEVYA